jgi:hypothetical protein
MAIARMEGMKADLISVLTRAEFGAPMGDASILGGRTRAEYDRQEHLVDMTVDFIFHLLALDSGLTFERMLGIARLFYSTLLEPWYMVYGHPGNFGHPAREPGQDPMRHEAANFELRSAILEQRTLSSDFGKSYPMCP